MAAEQPENQPTDGRGFDIADAVALLVLVSVAFLIRVDPIDRTSLWWDELVHLQTASKGGLRSVFRAVKLGIPPGFGNAGAVPLDYLLLNGWLRLAPTPPVDAMEGFLRAPALAWSVLTVAATYLYGRRFFDRGLALVAATILALSVSHSLYAAEIRNYSLFALMTVVNLYAFSALIYRRRSLAAWGTYTLVALVYFATGFMSLLVTLGQYVVLAVLLLVDAWRSPRTRRPRDVARLSLPLLSGLVVLAVVGAYLRGTFLGVRYGRSTESLDTWERTYTAIDFFAFGNDVLLAAFAAGIVLLLLHERRRGREAFAVATGLVASFLTIPVIVEIERWKEYYFHPRHAFFLIPVFAIVAAGGLLAALRGFDPLRRGSLSEANRSALYTAIAIVLVFLTQVGPVFRHLDDPDPAFRRSKTLRDFRGLMHHLRSEVSRLAPDQVYLLITERRRPGHIGNPVLAKYLEWYGLADRVVLRGTDHPNDTRKAIGRVCPDGCAGKPAARVQKQLGAIGPFNSRREMLDLVEVAPQPQTGAPLGGIGLLHYWRMAAGPPFRASGFSSRVYEGMTLFEPSEPPHGSLEDPDARA